MRQYHRDINRVDEDMTSATHLAIATQQPTDSHVPNIIDYTPRFASETEMIQLTATKRITIKAQDRIEWNQFIWGRTAKDFAPAIQMYYINNKLGKHSTPLRWSIEINKYNFLIHQTT